ncbi:hypothetical protein GCM10022631_13970 [Deinococcus rubellus]|uniref:IS66 family transposase n=1 Tax=Deinococcus rubellus TaxID=1889240 RepID=UPI00337574CA
MAVYLKTAHFVPLERTTKILEAVCGARSSEGIIVLNPSLAAAQLEGIEPQLKAARLQRRVLHTDETSSILARTDPSRGLRSVWLSFQSQRTMHATCTTAKN